MSLGGHRGPDKVRRGRSAGVFLRVRRAGYHPGRYLRPRPAPVSVVPVVGRVAGADADFVLRVLVQAFEGMRGRGKVGVAVLLGVRRVVVNAPGPVHPVVGGRIMRRLWRLPGDDQRAGVVAGGVRAADGAVLGLLGLLGRLGCGFRRWFGGHGQACFLPGAAPWAVGVFTLVVARPHAHLVLGSGLQVRDGDGGDGPFRVEVAFVDPPGLVVLTRLRPVHAVVGGRGAGHVPGDDEGSGGVAAQRQTGDGSIGVLRLRDPGEDAAEGCGGQQQDRQKRQAPVSGVTKTERIDRCG